MNFLLTFNRFNRLNSNLVWTILIKHLSSVSTLYLCRGLMEDMRDQEVHWKIGQKKPVKNVGTQTITDHSCFLISPSPTFSYPTFFSWVRPRLLHDLFRMVINHSSLLLPFSPPFAPRFARFFSFFDSHINVIFFFPFYDIIIII